MRLALIAASALLLGCSGSLVGTVPPAAALVLSARVLTGSGSPVVGQSARVSLLRRSVDPVDSVGSCVGRVVGPQVSTVSNQGGALWATLIDHNPTPDSACIAVELVGGFTTVFAIPIGPLPEDPSYGESPRDTLRVVLVAQQD